MNRLLSLLLCGAAFLPTASAQDVIHFKFEAGHGHEVINYGDAATPREAIIEPFFGGSPSVAWGAGRFGGGLAAGPNGSTSRGYTVNTGWHHEVGNSDCTIAFFMKVVHPFPSNSGSILFGDNVNGGGSNGVLMVMDGVASRFGWLVLRWESAAGRELLYLQEDLLTPAFGNWIHVALVIDNQARTSRWFIDGMPRLPQALRNPQRWTSMTHSNLPMELGDDREFAFDEFRISLRAVPPAEILEWATQEPAGHGAFGEACHPLGRPVLLDGSQGGPPTLGNAAYALDVYGLPGSTYTLGLGGNTQSFQGMPLPLDLGMILPSLAGCELRTSADLAQITGVIPATGQARIAVPIPNDPGLVGQDVYSQALLYSPILGTEMLTNAWATSIGH